MFHTSFDREIFYTRFEQRPLENHELVFAFSALLFEIPREHAEDFS